MRFTTCRVCMWELKYNMDIVQNITDRFISKSCFSTFSLYICNFNFLYYYYYYQEEIFKILTLFLPLYHFDINQYENIASCAISEIVSTSSQVHLLGRASREFI